MSSTIGIVWDRVNSLVTAQGYARTTDPFSFDYQPDTKLDHVFHFQSARQGAEGIMGGDQTEKHQFTIFLAQRAKRDAYGAARQLKVDMDVIEAAMLGDVSNTALDYYVPDDGVTSDCRLPPSTDSDFVIGQLSVQVEFDRAL
jgi:hypothetical protein